MGTMPTEGEYMAALKRHLLIGLVVFPAGALIAFAAFWAGYGSVTSGAYGVPVGLLGASIVLSILARFGGPDDSKFEFAKQLRINRLRREREGIFQESDAREGRTHPDEQRNGVYGVMRNTDGLAIWPKYLIAAALGAISFAIIFFIRSGGRPEMAAGVS
jgi:hypothetical protein